MPVNPGFSYLNQLDDLSIPVYPQNSGLSQEQLDRETMLRYLQGNAPAPMPQPAPVRSPVVAPVQKPQNVSTRYVIEQGKRKPVVQPAPMKPISPQMPVSGFRGENLVSDMEPSQPFNEMIGSRLGEEFDYGDLMPPKQEMELPPREEEIPENFMQTTAAQRADEYGFDPRQLYVALSQFGAGVGNLRGKPTETTMPAFYKMQKQYETNEDKNDLKLLELDQKFSAQAAKTQKPADLLKAALTQAQTDSLKNKTAVEQEMNDPNSERSKTLKVALQAYMEHQGAKGFKSLDGMTGADVIKFLPAMQFGIAQQGLGARQSEALSAQDKARQQQIDEANKRFQKQTDETNKRFLLQIDEANKRGDKEFARKMELERIKFINDMNLNKQKDELKDGAGGGEGAVRVPGWKQTTNVPLEKKELTALRGATASIPQFIRNIQNYQNMIKQYGPFENPFSETGAKMQTLARQLQLEAKNPDFFALGVLAGPDLELLESVIPSSSSPKSILLSKDAAKAQLDEFIKNLRSKLSSKAASMGFEPDAGRAPTQPAQNTPSGDVGVRGRPVWKPKQ